MSAFGLVKHDFAPVISTTTPDDSFKEFTLILLIFYSFQIIPMWKDQFHYTIDAASDIIVAYAQPDLNISKAEQIAVLEEFGKVIN